MNSGSGRKKTIKTRAKKRAKNDVTITEQSIIEADEMDFDDPEAIRKNTETP